MFDKIRSVCESITVVKHASVNPLHPQTFRQPAQTISSHLHENGACSEPDGVDKIFGAGCSDVILPIS